MEEVNLNFEMMEDAIVIAYLKDVQIARDFYRALCNVQWVKISHLPEDEQIIEKLKGIGPNFIWSVTWRSAGGIIADIRNKYYNTSDDYMDFYCSGDEGHITDLVRECFYRMGWKPLPWTPDEFS
jgi:hypothetical protein